MPNLSSLASLELADKFVVVGLGGWFVTLLPCLTPMLVALEFDLRYFCLLADQYLLY